MTYSPGSPGYPPAQSPGGYGASSAPSFTKSDDGESNLTLYLTIAVVALGLAELPAELWPDDHPHPAERRRTRRKRQHVADRPGACWRRCWPASSLLPKAKNYAAVVAAVAVAGCMLLIEDTHRRVGRGLGAVVRAGCRGVQAILAVSALLLDAGVITPPAPRPKYDQYAQYGQYGGYYGQQQFPTSSPDTAPSTAATRPGRRPAASAAGPQSGPIQSPQSGPQQARRRPATGSPTPPTGFPSFSPPPCPAPAARVRATPRSRRLRTGSALVRPGAAAADAVLAVGPVTVLTVRTRARRVVGQTT